MCHYANWLTSLVSPARTYLARLLRLFRSFGECGRRRLATAGSLTTKARPLAQRSIIKRNFPVLLVSTCTVPVQYFNRLPGR